MGRDRLVRLVAFETGLDDEKAEKAIEVVESYLKERFPVMLHTTLEKAIDGQNVEDSVKEQIVQSTAYTREKISEFAHEAGEKIDELSKELKSKFEDFFGRKK